MKPVLRILSTSVIIQLLSFDLLFLLATLISPNGSSYNTPTAIHWGYTCLYLAIPISLALSILEHTYFSIDRHARRRTKTLHFLKFSVPALLLTCLLSITLCQHFVPPSSLQFYKPKTTIQETNPFQSLPDEL